MTREELIAYGKRRYGKIWVSKLAAEINIPLSTFYRMTTGEYPVSRLVELEIKELKRKDGYAAMLKPHVKVSYE